MVVSYLCVCVSCPVTVVIIDVELAQWQRNCERDLYNHGSWLGLGHEL